MTNHLSDAALDALHEVLAEGGVAVIRAVLAGELRAAGLVECLGNTPRRGYACVRVSDIDEELVDAPA